MQPIWMIITSHLIAAAFEENYVRCVEMEHVVVGQICGFELGTVPMGRGCIDESMIPI